VEETVNESVEDLFNIDGKLDTEPTQTGFDTDTVRSVTALDPILVMVTNTSSLLVSHE